ncbi:MULTISPECIES: MerR family transcriptional regulator [unclassified Lysinibacillus]|uniref:MerR family transcriptional regulator n=1 Tax=unclassified Lysinibacillus TaxID=2636778 RepID=UPI00131F479A|nr:MULTISPECIES: MerR family transcriptional regulator [unclassified Lysinibacillus]
MKIGEYADLTGISKDTIRYYEKIGLLEPEIKNKHRNYKDNDAILINTIIKLKQTGFSLLEIKILFDWSKNLDQHKKLTQMEIQNVLQIKEIFQNKYAQIEQQENHIKQIKQVLLNANHKMEQLLERNKG